MHTELDNDDKGRWVVTTQTARHYVNLDARVVTRVPLDDPVRDWEVAVLRHDEKTLPLIVLDHCRVGDPAVFFINVLQDGVTFTNRMTTPVVSIEAF